ncbi:protein phosphatase 2C family [Kipferlia bialata]|uniref:Protein phosphatase 2C family n=1 Tax=Kipferlia bialata TaxID=797122 RepID=A0A9K3CV59_9EUKA|nr:protein phosphatase 2C family [Kipferlia bialata]|eukprot:g5306.t1
MSVVSGVVPTHGVKRGRERDAILPLDHPAKRGGPDSATAPVEQDRAEDASTAAGIPLSSEAHISVGAMSTRGLRSYQEDAFCVVHPFRGDPAQSLFCVFDGHGGDHVSQFARDTLPGMLAEAMTEQETMGTISSLEDYTALFTDVFHAVDTAAKAMLGRRNGGTTALVVYRCWSTIVTASAGDSVAMLLTDTPSEATLISAVHNVAQPAECKRVLSLGASVLGRTRPRRLTQLPSAAHSDDTGSGTEGAEGGVAGGTRPGTPTDSCTGISANTEGPSPPPSPPLAEGTKGTCAAGPSGTAPEHDSPSTVSTVSPYRYVSPGYLPWQSYQQDGNPSYFAVPTHPRLLNVTRGFGGVGYEPVFICQPEVQMHSITPSHTSLVLGSDGLLPHDTDPVTLAQCLTDMTHTVAHMGAAATAHSLVAIALHCLWSSDNVTAIAVQFHNGVAQSGTHPDTHPDPASACPLCMPPPSALGDAILDYCRTIRE